MKRRTFLKRTAGYAVATLGGAQLAIVGTASSAATSMSDAEAALIASLFPGLVPEHSDKVQIRLPSVTTSDLAFMARVTTEDLPLDAVALMVAGEAEPLAHAARFYKPASHFEARMAMERSAEVNAYVQSGGRLYLNTWHVKVTLGGYGTNFG